jgi:hypothetical protein
MTCNLPSTSFSCAGKPGFPISWVRLPISLPPAKRMRPAGRASLDDHTAGIWGWGTHLSAFSSHRSEKNPTDKEFSVGNFEGSLEVVKVGSSPRQRPRRGDERDSFSRIQCDPVVPRSIIVSTCKRPIPGPRMKSDEPWFGSLSI